MSGEAEQEFLQWDHERNYLYAGDQPVCFHCHHYNLFIQETIDEALGSTRGEQLRKEASADAWRPVLEALFTAQAIHGSYEKLSAAFDLFANTGQGKLVLEDASLQSAFVSSDSLHYGTAWRVVHGAQPALHPTDGLAAGFIGVAFELAYDLAPGSIEVTQTSCVAMGDSRDGFKLTQHDRPRELHPAIGRAEMEAHTGEMIDSLEEATVSEITQAFCGMLAQITSDERGLVEGFGILVTLTPTAYYNTLCLKVMEYLEEEHPTLLQVSEQMLYEAGRLCGFNTFGGVLKSPEWEALIGGERTADPRETLLHTCAIARSFGFGKWSVHEYFNEDLLVLRAPATYEDPFVRALRGESKRPVCYLFTGAGESMARLAEDVDWSRVPMFGLDYYDKTVKQADTSWRAKQTQCRARGDAFVEVTVEH